MSTGDRVDVHWIGAEDHCTRLDCRAVVEPHRVDDALDGSSEGDGMDALYDLHAAPCGRVSQAIDDRLPAAIEVQHRCLESQLQLLDGRTRALPGRIVGECRHANEHLHESANTRVA